ncbi:hypothetical protein ACRALDRAFT_1064437 [Sodiomyces alcalophilus JCM 7366]|uniref:uncharacterized protein n=1 Tax=Sodiomyces alcalophilus JCM 7366 TaxID=591952 RepID=UPI0039B5DFF8
MSSSLFCYTGFSSHLTLLFPLLPDHIQGQNTQLPSIPACFLCHVAWDFNAGFDYISWTRVSYSYASHAVSGRVFSATQGKETGPWPQHVVHRLNFLTSAQFRWCRPEERDIICSLLYRPTL